MMVARPWPVLTERGGLEYRRDLQSAQPRTGAIHVGKISSSSTSRIECRHVGNSLDKNTLDALSTLFQYHGVGTRGAWGPRVAEHVALESSLIVVLAPTRRCGSVRCLSVP